VEYDEIMVEYHEIWVEYDRNILAGKRQKVCSSLGGGIVIMKGEPKAIKVLEIMKFSQTCFTLFYTQVVLRLAYLKKHSVF